MKHLSNQPKSNIENEHKKQINGTKWWYRLAKVVYYFGLSFAVLIAIGTAFSIYSSQEWLPYLNSVRLFTFAITGLSAIIFLEVVRRTLAYISMNANFLDKKFPKMFMILVGIFFIELIAAGSMKYVFEPSLRLKWEAEQKVKDENLLQDLKAQLEVKIIEGKSCLMETQQKEYEKAKKLCDANYRKVKMGYDSCMVYGWNTMCLEYNDYEVIDCSEKTLKKPVENYYFICDGLDVISIKNKIEEVQKKITNY